jgi:hypothetical protein
MDRAPVLDLVVEERDSGGANGQSFAVQFVPSASAMLDQISVGVTIFREPTVNALTITLHEESVSGGPGAALESFLVIGAMGTGADPMRVSAFSLLHPSLVAGAPYWISAAVTQPLTDSAAWGTGLGSGAGLQAFRPFGATSWTVGSSGPDRVAFQVQGIVVPEPSSIVLLGSCLLIAFAARKRRNRQAF